MAKSYNLCPMDGEIKSNYILGVKVCYAMELVYNLYLPVGGGGGGEWWGKVHASISPTKVTDQ